MLKWHTIERIIIFFAKNIELNTKNVHAKLNIFQTILSVMFKAEYIVYL